LRPEESAGDARAKGNMKRSGTVDIGDGVREILTAPKRKQAEMIEAALRVGRGDVRGPLLVTAGGAARRLGVSRSCIYSWCKRGLLKPVGGLAGARQRFSTADLDKLAAGGGQDQAA